MYMLPGLTKSHNREEVNVVSIEYITSLFISFCVSVLAGILVDYITEKNKKDR